MALRLLGATGVLGLEPTAGVHALVRVEWMPEGARHQGTRESYQRRYGKRDRVAIGRMIKEYYPSYL